MVRAYSNRCSIANRTGREMSVKLSVHIFMKVKTYYVSMTGGKSLRKSTVG